MFKKLTGYILAGIGLIGYEYFRNYSGSIIPYSIIWMIVSIIIGITGVYLIVISKRQGSSKQEKFNRERLEKLKQSGERILITMDNCEIKSNNYYEEQITENSSRAQQIDALYDPNKNYKQNYVQQSAIVYYYSASDKKYRMASQIFSVDAKVLANYIELKKIVLYVDRFNKNNYGYELLIDNKA